MPAASHPPGTFCWFECGSTNVAQAKKFYTGLFGWSAVEVPMPSDMGGTYTMLQIGEDVVGGMYPLAGAQFEGVPSHWTTYVAVQDTDAIAERTAALGGKILAPPMDVPDVGRMAVLQDPTGAAFAIFQAGGHPGIAQLGPVPGTFGWSELATRDTAAAKTFYTELFGWTAKTDDNPEMPYTEFQVEGKSIGGMMAMTPQHGDAPPHWLPYVMVKDCRATAKKVESLGGHLFVPPMDIPNVGTFSVFQDPTGAVLAVIQLTS
jgi:predicted enzyme related to lactoylglutathione lyase